VTIQIDRILRECISENTQHARLGRATAKSARSRLFSEILADLEIEGCAMRYLNSRGQIAWKATPRLRDHVENLRLDAEADYAIEDV
jgi:hypothetical protein